MSPASDYISHAEFLVWSCNTRELAAMPLLDASSWAGAIQQDILEDTQLLPAPTMAASAYHKIAAVMMVKDEEDIIKYTLNWLYFIGVRRFVILENDSADGTLAAISTFRESIKDIEILIVSDTIKRYIQAQKTTGAMLFAVSVWDDNEWILPVDCDEFLIPPSGLSILDTLDESIDAVVIPKVNHYECGDRRSASTAEFFFHRMSIRTGKWSLPPKVIVRANTVFRLGQGNHQVFRSDGAPVTYCKPSLTGFYYREFQIRSADHFIRKIRNGGPAILAAKQALQRDIGGQHWLNWYEILTTEGEDRLRQIYYQDFVKSAGGGYVSDIFQPESMGLDEFASHSPQRSE